jgi:glycosyltransferase involved in cell wall biosynthesis
MHKEFNKLNHVPEILTHLKNIYRWKPDLILTYGWRYSMPFSGLGMIKEIAKAHIICDFTPAVPGWRGTINEYFPMLTDHDYDFYFTMSYQAKKFMDSHFKSKKIFFLPFGVDHEFFRPTEERKLLNDAYIGWSNHSVLYPLRRPIEDLAKKSKSKILIKRIFQKAFVNTMNESLMVLNTSNVFRTLNMKVFEVMACNRLLITERVQELDDLGFKPFVHYFPFEKPQEVIDLIETFSGENRKYAEKVAEAGYRKTLEGHTNDHRVWEMTHKLIKYI